MTKILLHSLNLSPTIWLAFHPTEISVKKPSLQDFIIDPKWVLYEWELDFAVEAPHLEGKTSGIYRAENKYVWGVVYAISKSDKEELDKIEQGGYYPLEVDIKMQNSQEHLNRVIAYIPSQPKSSLNTKPNKHYIEVVLQGAKEHKLTELIDYLEDIRQSI